MFPKAESGGYFVLNPDRTVTRYRFDKDGGYTTEPELDPELVAQFLSPIKPRASA